jgi:Undecaprenyl-phosphate galactose phosphotransferase WbaP
VSDRRIIARRRSMATLTPVENRRLGATNRRQRRKLVWKQRVIVGTLVLTDVLLAFLVWGAAYVVDGFWDRGELPETAVAVITASVAVWVVLRALLGLYPGYGLDSPEKLRRHTYSVFGTLPIVAVFAVGLRVGDLLSRMLTAAAVAFLGLLILAPFIHHFTKLGMKRVRLWGKPVIILGYDETGVPFRDLLKQEWGLGYSPVALLSNHLTPAGKSYREVSCEGILTYVADLGRELGVDTLILATPYTRREQLASMVNAASETFHNVLIVPNLNGVTTSAVVARDLAGTFTLEIKHILLNPWSQRFKRTLDLLGVMIGGVLISPLLIAIAALIKLDSSGPVFYGQLRPGAGGKYFRCWKFRTMRVDAESSLSELLQNDKNLRAEWEENLKLRDDPRVTRVGRFLRKTSLDELPQLWNVLRREMSLVGPRPALTEEIPKYGEVYKLYKRMRPGITGLWQVNGRGDISHEERITIVAYYVRNWSIWLDIVILIRTVGIVILGRGAF